MSTFVLVDHQVDPSVGATVSVVQTEYHRALLSDETVIGMEYRPREYRLQAVFSAMALMQVVAFLAPTPQRALCLGLGAGTAPHFLRASAIHTDVVEYDAAVIALAEKHFVFGSDERSAIVGGGAVRHADAIALVESGAPPASDAQRYDVVLSDLWSGGNDGRALRLSFFDRIKSSWLRPKGVLAVNLVAFHSGEHVALAQRVARTMRAAFAFVKVFAEYDASGQHDAEDALPASAEPSNLLIVGSDEQIRFDYAAFRNARHYHYPYDDLPPEPGSMFEVHENFERWQPPELRSPLPELEVAEVVEVCEPIVTKADWEALAEERAAVAAGMHAVQAQLLPKEGWALLKDLGKAKAEL